MRVVDQGQPVTVGIQYADPTGQLRNPSHVKVVIEREDGSVFARDDYAVTPANFSNPSTGVFKYTIAPDAGGLWTWRMYNDAGSYQFSYQGWFTVTADTMI